MILKGKFSWRRRMALPPLLLLCGLSCASIASAASDGVSEFGRDLYNEICSKCHGPALVNPGGLSYDLRQFPTDDFQRFRNSVLNGKNQGMPAWRDSVNEDDIANLWAYVRSGGIAP